MKLTFTCKLTINFRKYCNKSFENQITNLRISISIIEKNSRFVKKSVKSQQKKVQSQQLIDYNFNDHELQF